LAEFDGDPEIFELLLDRFERRRERCERQRDS
jgi:hypothetical protein